MKIEIKHHPLYLPSPISNEFQRQQTFARKEVLRARASRVSSVWIVQVFNPLNCARLLYWLVK